jgi:hypothetical protein
LEGHDSKIGILDELEGGRIDVDEALRRLEGQGSVPAGASPPVAVRGWRGWWLIPFWTGFGLTGAGGVLAALGGGGWFGAVPLLLVGIPLMTLGAVSRTSPWVHVRIRAGEDAGARRIAVSLPIPVRLVAWVLRTFGPWIPGLKDTAVDELVMALDGNVSTETPLYVKIDDEQDGEQIEVYLG